MITRPMTSQEKHLVDSLCEDIYSIAWGELRVYCRLVLRDRLNVRVSGLYGSPDVTGICGYTDIFGTIYVHQKILSWEIGFALHVLAHEMVHARQYSTMRGVLWARTFGRWKAEKEAEDTAVAIYKAWLAGDFRARYRVGYNIVG